MNWSVSPSMLRCRQKRCQLEPNDESQNVISSLVHVHVAGSLRSLFINVPHERVAEFRINAPVVELAVDLHNGAAWATAID